MKERLRFPVPAGAFLLPSISMGIKFLCPNGHKMNVKAFLAGKRGKCPKCGASVRIPQETPASDSGEDLLGDAGGPETSSQPAVSQATARGTIVAAAPAPYTAAAPMVRPVLPVGAPAIPTVATMTPGYQPAGPAATRGPQPVSAPLPVGVDPISQAPNSIWYVRPPSGGQYGPARGDIMRKWISEGRVSSDSLVWREGWTDWQNAGKLFPTLNESGTHAPSEAVVPAVSTTVPLTARSSQRTATRYENKKRDSNAMAIAILVGLGILCLILIGILVYVVTAMNRAS